MQAEEFLLKHHMSQHQIDIGQCAALFLNEMTAGLEGGRGLPMIPTYLKAAGSVPKNVPVAVIDAGGTNFRCALVTFTDAGYEVDGLVKMSMPGMEKPCTWREFIDFTADALMPFMDRVEHVGFCFSYYAEITPERDGKDPRFTKQVKITGSEGKYLCGDLKAALERRGVSGKSFVLLNDTAAVLLGVSALLEKSDYDGFAGLVAGTGLNTCCLLPASRVKKLRLNDNGSMLINLESGYMTTLPRGDADMAVDTDSIDPGHCLYEKMTSGAYLGEVVRKTLFLAAEEGLICSEIKALGHINAAEADKWCGGEIPPELAKTPADIDFIRTVSRSLFDRAAKCVAANLAAVLMLTDEGKKKPACVCAEGSLFLKSRYFRPALEGYMTEYAGGVMGRKFKFRTSEDTTLLGSAAAALLN